MRSVFDQQDIQPQAALLRNREAQPCFGAPPLIRQSGFATLAGAHGVCLARGSVRASRLWVRAPDTLASNSAGTERVRLQAHTGSSTLTMTCPRAPSTLKTSTTRPKVRLSSQPISCEAAHPGMHPHGAVNGRNALRSAIRELCAWAASCGSTHTSGATFANASSVQAAWRAASSRMLWRVSSGWCRWRKASPSGAAMFWCPK